VLGMASIVGAGQRFVLVASEDPVPIVDGESTFLLDTVVPTDTQIVAYKLSTVNNNQTAAFPRFTMAVQHGQPTERGIDGEVEAADDMERQQWQTDGQGHTYGALDVVTFYIGKQTALHSLYSREVRTD